MGKRKGRQRDTAFSTLTDDEFQVHFYDRRVNRELFDPVMRQRIEREGKARGLRNIQKRVWKHQ